MGLRRVERADVSSASWSDFEAREQLLDALLASHWSHLRPTLVTHPHAVTLPLDDVTAVVVCVADVIVAQVVVVTVTLL